MKTAAQKSLPQLLAIGKTCREKLREEMQVEFTIQNGKLHILDAVRVQRASRASVRIAVAWPKTGSSRARRR